MLRNFLFLLFFLFNCLQLSATHIIGGSLTYEYLGNDDYLIKLEVLRDCYNGAPEAWFDNPASVGIFDTNNVLIEELSMSLDPTINDTITLYPENNICTFDEYICIHRTFYEEVINLPAIAGGYQLAYQRCCRSETITNLAIPLEVGMTFHTEITTEVENSSPQWNKDVPFGIYVGVPFVYDGSAFDAEGDSIVYSLVAPSAGADQNIPQPQPPGNPPYEFTIFEDGFSVENMLGGNYPLLIDAVTGEMTAIPAFTGLFQMACQAEEYRNDVLISTIRREFTFAVTPANPDLTFDFSGTVTAEGQALDIGTVELLERDISTDLLSSVEMVDVMDAGQYALSEVPAGVFYFRAEPAVNSIFYDEFLPTYYRDALFWYETDALSQCDTSQLYRDIELVKAEMLLSNGSMFSGIIQQENGTPVPNLFLLLRNENTGDFIKHVTTEVDGTFSFSNLSDSNTYGVYVDLINSNVLNTEVPIFTLQADKTATGILYDDRLEFNFETGTTQEIEQYFEILPNPSSGIFSLEISEDFALRNAEIEIRDVSGKLILEENLISINQEFSIREKGLFFVSVVNESGTYYRKLIVE